MRGKNLFAGVIEPMVLERPSDERLIETKYSRPRANEHIISRQHLYKKLDNPLKRKLTLVTAPSGYGKTTAVLEWLQKSGVESAWLSVDQNDNNPLRFWRYLCAALDKIAPGIALEAEYVFSSQELINAHIQINIIIDWLMMIEYDFTFVIDDVHLISNPLIWKGLSYLIDYLPPRMHLLFISRISPGGRLAKHSIKSQVQKLVANDLRFREEEIEWFYEKRGFALDSQDIKIIQNTTDGWAAALVAIAMSMEESTDNREAVVNLAWSNIEQYLAEEVIGNWPVEKRMFALKTSILDTLYEDLCDAVTGDDNGSRMLKELSERNEFLVSLDEENRSYKYHQLFKDFHSKLLEQSAAIIRADLHCKAAQWYLQHGLITDAINHYLNGQWYDAALKLIETQLGGLAAMNAFDTALSWLERLPPTYRDKSVKIAAFYSLFYAEQNHLEMSRQWITKANDLMQAISDAETKGQGEILVGLTWTNLLLMEGKIEELFSVLKNLEAKGRLDKGIEFYDSNRSDIYFYRCPVNALATQLTEKNNELYEMIEENYRKATTKNAGYFALAAGEYYYEKNRLDKAKPYLVQALELAQAANCAGVIVPAMVNIARIKRASGDLPRAFQALEECQNRLKTVHKAHWNMLLQAFTMRLCLDTGSMQIITKWLNTNKLNIYSDINKVMEFEFIVFARVLMAGDQYDDAEMLLLRLLSFAGGESRQHSKVEILNLLAILLYKKNDLAGAVDYLEKSLSIGMKEGYIRSYVDELDLISGLLKDAIGIFRRRGDSYADLTSYARELYKQVQDNMCGLSIPRHGGTASPRRKLTAKETEVLKLMLAAYSNEEICSKLNITIRTVKAHTGNIYSKLGVKNRAQCIKLVRETPLLE
ncbi:MAG TPA: LuxR C-terminal-related transcriptional regulator [Syntrophomonadaceae bacterium]|nr:LuxR C-terminal-related transcriptional regulator [Syntrophomonadaceae bacterium]